eukprot:14037286-Ditylum_brightwellii.AAC.1
MTSHDAVPPQHITSAHNHSIDDIDRALGSGYSSVNIRNWDRWSAARVHILKKKIRNVSYNSIEDALKDKDNYDMLADFCNKYYALLDEASINPPQGHCPSTKRACEHSPCSTDNKTSKAFPTTNNKFLSPGKDSSFPS